MFLQNRKLQVLSVRRSLPKNRCDDKRRKVFFTKTEASILFQSERTHVN